MADEMRAELDGWSTAETRANLPELLREPEQGHPQPASARRERPAGDQRAHGVGSLRAAAVLERGETHDFQAWPITEVLPSPHRPSAYHPSVDTTSRQTSVIGCAFESALLPTELPREPRGAGPPAFPLLRARRANAVERARHLRLSPRLTDSVAAADMARHLDAVDRVRSNVRYEIDPRRAGRRQRRLEHGADHRGVARRGASCFWSSGNR